MKNECKVISITNQKGGVGKTGLSTLIKTVLQRTVSVGNRRHIPQRPMYANSIIPIHIIK